MDAERIGKALGASKDHFDWIGVANPPNQNSDNFSTPTPPGSNLEAIPVELRRESSYARAIFVGAALAIFRTIEAARAAE